MSGKKLVTLGDLGTDHEGFPPTPVIAGSPDVYIDGKPAIRVGDPLAPHSKPKHPPHPRIIVSGEPSILINGKPAAVTGGAIDCGGATIGSASASTGAGAASVSVLSAPGSAPSTAAAEARTSNPAGQAAAGHTGEPNSALGQRSSGESGNTTAIASQAQTAVERTDGEDEDPDQDTHEPGFYVVREPMTQSDLLGVLFGSAQAKPDNFDRLNPGLRSRVLPGEMIVLGDPKARECTAEEARLMEVAAEVNRETRELTEGEAQFLADNYDFLQFMVSSGAAGIGAGSFAIGQQLNSIKAALGELEELHQRSYSRHGHLNHETFFHERRAIFRRLDFALGSIARRGMSLDADSKLKRALGLSSKSIVHHWKTAGVGDIPGYSTHYGRVASAARWTSRVGYAGIALDLGATTMAIREACTFGSETECERASYTEFGRFGGSAFGGGAGGTAGVGLCIGIGFSSAGIGGLACALILGGAGSVLGGQAGGDLGESFGDKLYELIFE